MAWQRIRTKKIPGYTVNLGIDYDDSSFTLTSVKCRTVIEKTSTTWYDDRFAVNGGSVFSNFTCKPDGTGSGSWPYYSEFTLYKGTTGGSFSIGDFNAACTGNSAKWDNFYGGSYCTVSGVTIYAPASKIVTAPSINTPGYSSVTNSSAYLSFSVADNHNQAPWSHTIEISSDNFASIAKTISGTSGTVSGLSANTTYYARARATNDGGTGYSGTTSFKTCDRPYLNSLSYSGVSDKSAYLTFGVSSENGASVSSRGIQLSLSNFGSVTNSLNAYNGTISGLTPNRTYYGRGYATNAYGTTYTNVVSFKTSFINPGAPGKPSLSYDQTEPIPKAKLTAKWSAANAGSTAIAGYRIRLFKNNTEVACIDTENTNTSYTFNSFESYGFAPGDVAKVGIYSYCKDWAGNKLFNGSGSGEAQIYSNTLKVVSDKYIFISQNGGAFIKYKMYISVNGGSYVEVKKEKFKVI